MAGEVSCLAAGVIAILIRKILCTKAVDNFVDRLFLRPQNYRFYYTLVNLYKNESIG